MKIGGSSINLVFGGLAVLFAVCAGDGETAGFTEAVGVALDVPEDGAVSRAGEVVFLRAVTGDFAAESGVPLLAVRLLRGTFALTDLFKPLNDGKSMVEAGKRACTYYNMNG
jgi:hypothetical protein